MKINILAFVFFMTLGAGALASQADSLLTVLEKSEEDSLKVQTLLSLASIYYRTEPDKAIAYGTRAQTLSEAINYPTGLAYAFKSIGMGYYFKSNYVEALLNWERSLEVFEMIGNQVGMSNMLNNLGAVYYNEGDNNKAIEYYLESLKMSEETGDTLRRVTALVNIGSVYYSKEGTHDLALKYYAQALPISEALGDHDAIGTTAVNMGQIYLEREDDDSALYYFDKALYAYKLSETGNVAYAMLNIGRVYSFRGEYDKALRFQQDAYNLASENGAKLEMAQAMLSLGDTYDQMGRVEDAIANFKRSRDLSEDIGASYVLKDSYNGLAVTYAEIQDYENAFKYQSLFNDVKDTLYNAAMDKQIQAQTLTFEIMKKQGQIDLLTKDQELKDLAIQRQKLQRNAVAITGILLLLLAIGLFNRYRYVRKTKGIIEYEKDRSDQLLLNVLPAETAEELKEKGSATPKHYDLVTVLFTDFKGFTKIAEKLSPQELVENLDFCFHAFDKIIDKYKIEKIKTIGDAYMCAGGIPVKNTSNPIDVVNAALEIREFMEQLKRKKEANGEDFWELRIGIHTGPVIAGVVGNKKFAYDIWGDAVNTASRMESSGIPGKVNISGQTYHLIKDEFNCTFRGKIEAKNKGEIDMYIVDGQLESNNETLKESTVDQFDHQYQL
jgi:class 3 adenylate cyclase/lipopolysaccharide biosynthesis regulator YciM